MPDSAIANSIAAFGGESSKPASLDELLCRFDRCGRTGELSDFSPAALATLV